MMDLNKVKRIYAFRGIFACLSLLMMTFLSGNAAYAQCSKDTDCKGERICVDGKCVNPDVASEPLSADEIAEFHAQAKAQGDGAQPKAASEAAVMEGTNYPPEETAATQVAQDADYPPPPPPEAAPAYPAQPEYGAPQGYPPPREYEQNQQNQQYQLRPPMGAYEEQPYRHRRLRRPLSRGWAIPGGITGIVLGGVGLGLALTAEDLRHEGAALSWGGVAALTMAVAVPLTFSAGRSARNGDERVRGIAPLRILGWICYGVTMASAATLLFLGLLDATPDAGWIGATGGLGFASAVFMSVDAFVSAAQAGAAMRADRDYYRSHASASAGERKSGSDESRVLWTITAAPIMSASSVTGASLGVVGMF